MVAKRIVPCLDVRGTGVVKGVNFRRLVRKGDPTELAARYESEGADEIVLLKIDAGDGHPLKPSLVRSVARGLSIPLTVGGAIGGLDQAESLLAAGADRVSFNTRALARPGVLDRAADRFGRQAVVLAVDARRTGPGRYGVFGHGGRAPTGRDPAEWAREGAERGAGEILLTSIDRDGTRDGFDLDLLRAVRRKVPVPITVSGGARGPDSFLGAFRAGADAALAAGIFHDRVTSVGEVKRFLSDGGVEVRP